MYFEKNEFYKNHFRLMTFNAKFESTLSLRSNSVSDYLSNPNMLKANSRFTFYKPIKIQYFSITFLSVKISKGVFFFSQCRLIFKIYCPKFFVSIIEHAPKNRKILKNRLRLYKSRRHLF